QFFDDRRNDLADFVHRYINRAESARHIELRNELVDQLHAGKRRRFWLPSIERNAEALRYRAKSMRCKSCHEPHHVRECDTRCDTVGYVPSWSDLMPQQMR